MLNLVELDPGAVVPEHSHPHEQLGIGLSGLIVMTSRARSSRSARWTRCTSPPASSTAGVAGPEGAVVLDVFVPIREDFRALADAAE